MCVWIMKFVTPILQLHNFFGNLIYFTLNLSYIVGDVYCIF